MVRYNLSIYNLLGQNAKLWGSKEDPAQQHNFVEFFIRAVKSGALEEAARERGLVYGENGEVIDLTPDADDKRESELAKLVVQEEERER